MHIMTATVEDEEMKEDLIKVGDHIIIQKHNYKKLHKIKNTNTNICIGRDTVNLGDIAGKPYFSVFKMIPCSKKGREFRLEETDDAVELKDEIEIAGSGSDNRHIIDDGRSQKLSADEIRDLTSDANKASDIVETLISNSNTFHNKTEYSQLKYLNKKEKKYFEYLQVLKPNLRLIVDLMYRLDPGKIQNLRFDTLSQIMTMSNIQFEGTHLLYDSGSNGLMAAALLSLIGANTVGKLIHMHPGNTFQKQALLGMNFPEEQLQRCISVNIYSVLRQFYTGCDTHDKKSTEIPVETLKRKADNDVIGNDSKILKTDELQDITSGRNHIDDTTVESVDNTQDNDMDCVDSNDITKHNDENDKFDEAEPKKPKWHFDNVEASEMLTQKVDSLVITCTEDPLNIFLELLPFVKPSRAFVVYYPVAEPLQRMFIELKSNPKVCALNLTCNWMRNYQVLPERTHPEVMMNAQSGFLLTGYTLE